MTLLPVLFNVFSSLIFVTVPLVEKTDPCTDAKAGAVAAMLFAKDSLYQAALSKIKTAFAQDLHEHCISFGKDTANNIIASSVSNGSTTSGKVPAIANAFADLHNHPNNLPPDAGDFYGLIDINKNNTDYKTRFVLTSNGTLYALLVTDAVKALAFNSKHLRQPPAFTGGPPGFTVAITDEAREMKYKYNCTDEMVLAFIFEKYNTGVSLLKQNNNGSFGKIITTALKNGSRLNYSVGSCL